MKHHSQKGSKNADKAKSAQMSQAIKDLTEKIEKIKSGALPEPSPQIIAVISKDVLSKREVIDAEQAQLSSENARLDSEIAAKQNEVDDFASQKRELYTMLRSSLRDEYVSLFDPKSLQQPSEAIQRQPQLVSDDTECLFYESSPNSESNSAATGSNSAQVTPSSSSASLSSSAASMPALNPSLQLQQSQQLLQQQQQQQQSIQQQQQQQMQQMQQCDYEIQQQQIQQLQQQMQMQQQQQQQHIYETMTNRFDNGYSTPSPSRSRKYGQRHEPYPSPLSSSQHSHMKYYVPQNDGVCYPSPGGMTSHRSSKHDGPSDMYVQGGGRRRQSMHGYPMQGSGGAQIIIQAPSQFPPGFVLQQQPGVQIQYDDYDHRKSYSNGGRSWSRK